MSFPRAVRTHTRRRSAKKRAKAGAGGEAASKVQVGTHFFHQRYLYAFATQAEISQYIRTQAIPEELPRLPSILESWSELQPKVTELSQTEALIAEGVGIAQIPAEHMPQVTSYAQDHLFQKTFFALPTGFAVVEIDKLIAPQRTVNLDYVRRLQSQVPAHPSMADLVRICISPTRQMDPIQHLEVGPNIHVFSSPNSDIRFLGSFVKPLIDTDLAVAETGGLPAAAVISFIGYGAASMNVIKAGNRLILNNGFHRVYALRDAGITHIPVVVQMSTNPALDFPPQVAGLPREYLLGVPRPVLMKDFFEPTFAITLKVRDRLKIVTLSVALGQHEVPS